MKELQIDFEYPGFLKPKTSRPMHKMLEQGAIANLNFYKNADIWP